METAIENFQPLSAPPFCEVVLPLKRPAAVKVKSLTLAQRYNAFVESLKPSYYSVISMVILIGSCIGSIAAMAVFYNHAEIWIFALGLFPTMASLVACISQAPIKW